jgi:Cupin-like domain
MRALTGIDPLALPDALLQSAEPVLLRGLVAHWPAARAGARSGHEAAAYLHQCWQGATVGMLIGPPEIEGRFFYNDDLTGFNFRRETGRLDEVLQTLVQLATVTRPPALYVGSTTVDTCLPGFRADNPLGFGPRDPLASVWLGNRSRIAAHFDVPDNLACVVAGRRRFTLFPPEAVDDLYVGPLDFTPAGQAISLVDFAQPDLVRFPRFPQALARAQVVELEPGDAVFIPSMWWHHVEALEPFNVLVNYWWRQSPDHMDTPMAALFLALMTVRDLPPVQREAWRKLFSQYVFDADAHTAAHVPTHAQGALAPMDEERTHRLRAELLRRLRR